MDYLKQVLGINVTCGGEVSKAFPNYISLRYKMEYAYLDEIKVIFVYPKAELDSIKTIKTHFEQIKNITNCAPVLILEHLSSRDKGYLIRERISFVVINKQIYLPFMAIYLTNKSEAEQLNKNLLLPSSQVLLLYFIYHRCKPLITSAAVKDLGFTPMSISRASRQLEELKIVSINKQGVQKIISSNKTPKELFEENKQYMFNPLKKTIYVSKNNLDSSFLLSGESALSHYSNLNSSRLDYYATDSISKYEKEASIKLIDSDEQYALELWRYNPHKLSGDNYVDRLSLVLSLQNNNDERIEQAIDEMLNDVWREIDDKRD